MDEWPTKIVLAINRSLQQSIHFNLNGRDNQAEDAMSKYRVAFIRT